MHLLVLQEHQNTIKVHVSLGLRRGATALRGERKREEKVGWKMWTNDNDALLSDMVNSFN